MTPSVHSTANFMHWHRYYIWAYETALRTECNYKGYQPYWNWAKYSDIVNSPIFNGDEWSLGGNGDPVAHQGMNMGFFQLPAGPGGGCVTTGPFAKSVPFPFPFSLPNNPLTPHPASPSTWAP